MISNLFSLVYRRILFRNRLGFWVLKKKLFFQIFFEPGQVDQGTKVNSKFELINIINDLLNNFDWLSEGLIFPQKSNPSAIYTSLTIGYSLKWTTSDIYNHMRNFNHLYCKLLPWIVWGRKAVLQTYNQNYVIIVVNLCKS